MRLWVHAHWSMLLTWVTVSVPLQAVSNHNRLVSCCSSTSCSSEVSLVVILIQLSLQQSTSKTYKRIHLKWFKTLVLLSCTGAPNSSDALLECFAFSWPWRPHSWLMKRIHLRPTEQSTHPLQLCAQQLLLTVRKRQKNAVLTRDTHNFCSLKCSLPSSSSTSSWPSSTTSAPKSWSSTEESSVWPSSPWLPSQEPSPVDA